MEVKLSPSMPWRPIGEVEVKLHSFLISVLDGGEWSNLRRGPCFTAGKNPGGTQSAFNILGEKNPMQLPRIELRTIGPVA